MMSESLEGLQTVIFLDQHDRWRQGDRPLVENYLSQIPDLSTDRELLLDVIYHEILLREAAGEMPELSEYQRRFPELADAVAIQFEVHSGMPGTGFSDDEDLETHAHPQIIGYRIVRELGRGTYGIVYEAWEQALQRSVALKVIFATGNSDDWSFREAQAIAQLTHPNIVPVHAVGETTDGIFFSQDLVTDGTLAEFCRGTPQPIRESAAFVAILADAVQYAHLRQLIHCDLKPSNILLRSRTTRNPEKSTPRLADFDPLISDFGLAVHLDTENRAFQGHLRGTLQYMAPEQTGQTGLALGSPTDIYALGVILYELLTGRLPFSSDSKLTTFLQIRHTVPAEPRTLRTDLPGDLNAICLACLEKDPAKRYPSAAALANDLRRFLNGFAPTVVATGTWGHFARWCRRRPAVAALSAAMICLTVGSFAAVTENMRRAQRAEQAERRRADELDTALYRNQFLLAVNAWEQADVGRALKLLEEMSPRHRSFEWYDLQQRCTGTQTRIPWEGHDTSQLAVSPDGNLLAVGDAVDQITLLDSGNGKPLHTLSGHEVRLTPPVFHPQGMSVAAAGIDQKENRVWIWDIASGKEIQRIGPLSGTPFDLIFIDHGEQLVTASCHDRDVSRPLVIEIWDTRTGKRLSTVTGPSSGQSFTPKGRLSPDGKWLAWTPSLPQSPGTSHRHQVELIDAQTGTVAVTLKGHVAQITTLAFSPDSQVLATFDDEQGGFLWSPATGKVVHHLTGLADAALSVSFSPDGKTLATAGRDQLISLWSCESGERLRTLHRHTSLVWAAAFGPSTTQLFSADKNRQIYRWQTDASDVPQFEESPAVMRMAFSGDGNALLFADLNASWQTRNLITGEITRQPEWALDFAVCPKSDVVASMDRQGQLRIGPWTDPTRCQLIDPLPKLSVNGSSPLIATPDGNTVLALAATGKEMFVIDITRKKLVGTMTSPGPAWSSLAISSDGKTLAIAGDDRSIQLWSFPERKLLRRIHADFPVRSLAFRHGGNELAAIAVQDRFVQFWNAKSGEPVRRITGHKLQITRFLFTPDGKRLITGSADRTVHVWDCDSNEVLLTHGGFADEIRGLAISADGDKLVVYSGMTPEKSRIAIFGGSAN